MPGVGTQVVAFEKRGNFHNAWNTEKLFKVRRRYEFLQSGKGLFLFPAFYYVCRGARLVL